MIHSPPHNRNQQKHNKQREERYSQNQVAKNTTNKSTLDLFKINFIKTLKPMLYGIVLLAGVAYIVAFILIALTKDKELNNAYLRDLQFHILPDIPQEQIGITEYGSSPAPDSENFTYSYIAKIQYTNPIINARSSSISNITLHNVSWISGIGDIEAQSIHITQVRNRELQFTSTKDLSDIIVRAGSSLDSNTESIKSQFGGDAIAALSYSVDYTKLLTRITSIVLVLLAVAVLLALVSALIFIDVGLVAGSVVKFFTQENLLGEIYNRYKGIDSLYRHTFWILFIACNVVFFFHTAQFLWGREDVGITAFNGTMTNWTTAQGRYTQNLQVWLHNYWILPVLNNLLSFVALSISAILISVYLGLQRRLWIYVLVGLCFCIEPFILGRLYFAYQAAGLFIGAMVGILGFVLAKRAGQGESNYSNTDSKLDSCGQPKLESSTYYCTGLWHKLKPYALCLLATLCIHWGIASYQVFIDSALILLCCGGIALIVENKGNIKLAIFKARFLIIATFLAALSYKIVLDILKKIDYVEEVYNNKLTPLSEMPERIILAFKYGFSFLFAPQMEYIAQGIGIVFGIIFIVAFICLYRARFSNFAKFCIIVLFIAMIFASQTHIILANAMGGGLHLHFYGLMFLYVGIIASVFKLFDSCLNAESSALDSVLNLARNALSIVVCIFIWISALHCLQAQRIHKFTIDKDLAFVNRIVERIENLQGFSYGKQYCGVMFGSPQNAFTKAVNADVLASWDMGPIVGQVMMKDVFKSCGMLNDSYAVGDLNDTKTKAYKKRLKRLYDAGIFDTLQPFPHKDSIVLFEDIIVFVASPENLIDKIKQDFANGEK